MDDDHSPSRFRYHPLSDSTSRIRLLEVLCVEQHVTCQLTAWALESAPLYHALSYTWGNEASLTQIIVNHREMTVRTNCEYALRQAHASGSSRYYWVDAICIDQLSTQEKNHQVAMMGQIYTKASHVLACIGPHSHGSELLLTTMAKHESLLECIHKQIKIPEFGGRRAWHMPNPIPTTRWLSLRCFVKMGAEARRNFSEAVIAFLTRPYFTRLWVLQELHLASSSSFCCGMDIRSVDQLVAASMLVDFWINQHDYLSHWSWPTRKFVTLLARQPILFRRQKSCRAYSGTFNNLQPQRGCLALTSGARGPRRFADVLDEMQHFQCTDLRDKLYGILSLVEWGTRERPDPDYAKDTFEVCVMVLELYLDDDMLAPTSGTYVEWARRLHEVFELRPESGNMWKSLEARRDSLTPPIILSKRLQLPLSGENAMHRLCRDSGADTSFHTINRRSRRHFPNMWYGVQLLQTPHNPPSIVPTHLYCRQRLQNTPSGVRALKELWNARSNLVALVSCDAQAGDWLVASFSSFLPTHDSVWMVVRLKEPLAIRLRHSPPVMTMVSSYTILGQATFRNNPKQSDLLALSWKKFSPRWDAEDLLILTWTSRQMEVAQARGEDINDWLSLRVCKEVDSSDVDGPRPLKRSLRGNWNIQNHI